MRKYTNEHGPPNEIQPTNTGGRHDPTTPLYAQTEEARPLGYNFLCLICNKPKPDILPFAHLPCWWTLTLTEKRLWYRVGKKCRRVPEGYWEKLE